MQRYIFLIRVRIFAGCMKTAISGCFDPAILEYHHLMVGGS